MTRDVFISRWSAIAGVALALAAFMGIASCKRGEDNAAPETQETSAGDANVARVARDFGPALLKIATEYWIYHHEDYDSLLYAPHCGFIDLNGKIVIEPKWEEVRDFSEGIGLVKRDGKWGWFDKAGRLTEPSLDSFPFFHEGLTKLERGGKWGFMDTKGTVVIKPEWEDAGHFSGGYAAVKRDGKWGGIDKTGRLVMPFGKYEQLQFLPDPGMWLIKRDGKWGYVDRAGRVVIKPEWDDGGCYWSEGLSNVIRDGKWGFIDKTGKVVISVEWDWAFNFSEGLAAVRRDRKAGFIDKTGKFVIEPVWDEAENFEQGLAMVEREGKWGAIDKTGRVVVEPQWNDIFPLAFHQGLARILKDRKFGFIDRTGRVVMEPQWDVADSYQETEDKDAAVYWQVAREEKQESGRPKVRVLWLDSSGKQIWSSMDSNKSESGEVSPSPLKP